MRVPFALMLAASLALHVGVAAVVFVRHRPVAETPAQTTLTGETFDLSEALKTGAGSVTAPTDDPSPAMPETDPAGITPAVAASTPHTETHPVSASLTRASSVASPTPEEFGAVGERSAVDVAVAFTRAFPQAASGDPIWANVPFGSAGQFAIALELDDAGKLTASVRGGSATNEALRGGIERTIALIGNRTFVSTQPTLELRITANVSRDEVHDGLHGDVFAIGGSYSAGEGNAFFALASGRRVDVTIRAVSR